MSDEAFFTAAATAVLYLHFAVVVFNIFWLLAVPLGAWRGWRFVRSFWWRAAHLGSLAVVALQVLLGRLCFLTDLQDYFARRAGGPDDDPSLITRLVTLAVYWPLPAWSFLFLYILAVLFAVLLWFAVPPTPRRTGSR